MLSTGLVDRAQRLAAAATNPAEMQVGLGLIARKAGNQKAALGHFRRALIADPSNAEAQIALLQLLPAPNARDSGKDRLLRGLGHEPIPKVRLVAEAWELAQREEWQRLADREDELAAIAARDPAFIPATRLRAQWRLGTGDRDNARQALALLDGMVPIGGSLGDLILRARAASLAGYGAGAASSLDEVLRRTSRRPSHRRVLQDALELLDELPQGFIPAGRRRTIRRQLVAKLR